MKKYIFLLFAMVALTPLTQANTPTNIIGSIFDAKVTLPAGTLIYLEANERVMSDEATVGKLIQFKVKMNVTVDGKVVIATGAAAIGRIKSVSEATFNSPAEVTIELTSVQAVDGQQVPLNGTEQTVKGTYPNEGMVVNIGTSITANVMNDIVIKV